MTIHKEISRQEHSSVKLTVTIAKDDVRSQYDTVLNEYSKNLLLPGFRRGKIPKEVLIRKFGDALQIETMKSIVEKSAVEIFDDKDFPQEDRPLPYSTPHMEGEPLLDPEKDFSFSMTYDVLPTVNVGTWKGFEIEAPEAEVNDEDINRELEILQERNAIVLDRDDGVGAETGNVVTVTYCETDDNGKIVPNTERQDYVFTLGTGNNIYKFDNEILGMKKGETREFEKTRPAGKDPAGPAEKPVKLRVSLTALKERRLPELDDELAQDVDEKFHSLEDLKNSIRNSLTRKLENRLRDIKISMLLEKMIAVTPVDIPESMIRIELESRWRKLAQAFNVTVDQLKKDMETTDKSVEDIQNSWRPELVKVLHSRLIVETLIEELKLEAGDEELEQEIENMAAGEGARAETIRKYYEQELMRQNLRAVIKEKKIFDILLAESIIKPGKKENYLDLVPDNG
ncbi:MAG: trigger factor [Treponema sp.]|nr:trigger factor [Treponema sp.]